MTSDQKLKAEVNYGPHGVGKNKCPRYITKII